MADRRGEGRVTCLKLERDREQSQYKCRKIKEAICCVRGVHLGEVKPAGGFFFCTCVRSYRLAWRGCCRLVQQQGCGASETWPAWAETTSSLGCGTLSPEQTHTLAESTPPRLTHRQKAPRRSQASFHVTFSAHSRGRGGEREHAEDERASLSSACTRGLRLRLQAESGRGGGESAPRR